MSLGVGFLGAGRFATSTMAPTLAAVPGLRLAAVAARDLRRAQALQPDRAYDSYAALLGDDGVELVYLSLHNSAHYDAALAALAAGKHVLCEKPLALDAAQAGAMYAAARRADRLLVEASFYQWHPRTARARDLLAAGELGPVTHLRGGFCFPGVPAGNFRLSPDFGGGAGYDVGCYPVSALCWAAGPVRAVRARARYGPSGVDLTSELAVELADGAGASIRASIDEPARQWLQISGPGGRMVFGEPAYTSRQAPSELLITVGARTVRETFAPADPYASMLAACAAAIRGEPAYLVPAAQSVAAAAVLQAARSSAAAGGASAALP